MRNDFICQSDVGRLWGYDDSHVQIRKFLQKHARNIMKVPVGNKIVKLYERNEVMRLGPLYKQAVQESLARRDEKARQMGLARQAALRAAKLASGGVSSAARNMIYDLQLKLGALEQRINSLEDGLGVKKP